MGKQDVFVIITAIIAIFVSSSIPRVAGAAHNAEHSAAESAYGMANGKYGDPSGFQQNIANPMTSGSTQMTTLDGSTAFNAQLSCPSSSSFINVSIIPQATGDILVTVVQDTNFDGFVDTNYILPAAVSGICANGVVTCDAGTWLNCTYHEWIANPGTYGVTLNPVTITSLGGCYCVNASCMPGGYTDYSSILQSLGGGVAGAVQTVDSRFSVSKATVNATSIAYYGQDTSCLTGSTTTSSLQTYYNAQDSAGLTTNVNNEVLAQTIDTTSAYSNTKQVYDTTGPGVTISSCNITRNVVVNIDRSALSGGGSGSICTDHFLNSRVYETVNADGTVTYNMEMLDTSPASVPHQGCDGGGGGIGGWHPIDAIVFPKPATSISFCVTANGAGGGGCATGAPVCVTTANSPASVLECTAGGSQFPSYTYAYHFLYEEDIIAESVVDSCALLAADPACNLRTETIDGVVTYSNFISTGDMVPETCKTFTGINSHILCRTDWLKTREYFCTGTGGGTTFDFSNAQARAESVTGSLVQSGSTAAYTDYRTDTTGAFSITPETMTVGDTGTAPSCIDVCKVEVPATNTQAGLAGTTADFKPNASSRDVFYKQCSAGICPLDTAAGEVMLIDCACADDFAEAASIMTALQEASKDILCSSSGGW